MEQKEKFEEMVAYDYSTLDLQQKGGENYSCDDCFSSCDLCNCHSDTL
jgi:hypothetical protein